MSSIDIAETLPDDSRVWVFPFTQEIPDAKILELQTVLASELRAWNAHGADVDSKVFFDQKIFLFISALSTGAAPSGCSIDQMNSIVRKSVSALDLEIAPFSTVFFIDGDRVSACERKEFKTLAAEGKVSGNTHVFDTSITKASQLREAWNVPAKNSWHAQLIST